MIRDFAKNPANLQSAVFDGLPTRSGLGRQLFKLEQFRSGENHTESIIHVVQPLPQCCHFRRSRIDGHRWLM